MIGIGFVALLVVLGLAYSVFRRRNATGVTHHDAPVSVRDAGLERWVGAGLITEEQARAIATYEQERVAARPQPRVSPLVEALAYIGGVLLTVGAGMLVGQFWSRLGVAGHLGVLAAGAALTGAVGAVVGEGDPVSWRLRGFLWGLSTVAIGAVAGLSAFELLDLSGEPVALAVAGIGATASSAYWWLRDRPLQQALTFVGLAASVGIAIAWAGSGGLAIGAALWLLGLAWAGLAWRRLVPPPAVGFLLGMALTLVAAGMVGREVEWLAPILGLATATGWLAVGVARSERFALAPGIVGVFVFLPWTLGHFFGDAFGAPFVAMLSGALLLGVVLMLVRRGRGDGPVVGDAPFGPRRVDRRLRQESSPGLDVPR